MPAVTVIVRDPDEDLLYPSSDGEPMAETTLHVQAMIWLFEALQDFFRSAADVFVAADLMWYWEQGNPSACKAPDVMVVKGVDKRERRSWLSWRESNAIPNAIFEIACKGTWRENLYDKCRLFSELRAPEYFLFDPEAIYLRPALHGFRCNENGIYVPIEPDAQDRLKSEQLGLYLRAEGGMVRLIDAATSEPVLTKDERLAQKDERIAQLQALLEQAAGKQAP
jgi:Uma2 family endonuclease